MAIRVGMRSFLDILTVTGTIGGSNRDEIASGQLAQLKTCSQNCMFDVDFHVFTSPMSKDVVDIELARARYLCRTVSTH